MITNYKLYILSVLLAGIWTAGLWAQAPQIKTDWELNTDQSSAIENYVARDYVKLQSNGTISNFHFKATPGKSFNAKIDAGLLFPPTENSYALPNGTITTDPALGAVVGSIPGSASVTPTGGATYQIPIEVPAGINGMQPQVAITYNSQGGFGALGTGWDIVGGSSITCGGKNMYFDGLNDGIKLGITDALYLDGQRLILLSGTHFQVGAEYGTEVENYARVKIAESPITSGIYFIVTTKDGKTMEYGNTLNSWLKSATGGTSQWVLASKLNKVTDTYGNSMTYTYSDKGQYLQKIEYAGQSVEFAYNYVLAVPRKSYIKDFLVTQTKLLTSITTKSGTSTTLKTYGFNYKSTTDNRLDNVTETASDNTKVKATSINWGAQSAGITSQIVANNNIDKYLGDNGGSIYSADVNGDGYPDRIEFWPGANCDNQGNQGHVFVRLYNPSTKLYNTNLDGGYYFCPDNNLDPKLTIGDIDNDGKDEIILFKKDWLVVLGLTNSTLSEKYSGINFDLNTKHQGYNKDRKYQIFTANVNNDKYLDVVMVFGYHFDGFLGLSDMRAGYTVFKGSETGLTMIYDVSYNNDNAFKDFDLGDFDADGKVDVVGRVASTNVEQIYDTNYIKFYTSLSYYPCSDENTCPKSLGVYPADFNGDGKTELLRQFNGDANYNWDMIGINASINTNVSSVILNTGERHQMYPIDYNGDGLIDLILGIETYNGSNFDHTTWYFYKNTGGNFALEDTKTSNNRINKMHGFVADINGDGIADLVLPITNDATSTYNYIAYTKLNAIRRNLVIGITNGMNQSESFTYKNFSDYETYTTAEATAKVRPLRVPMLLVDTCIQADGNVTSYSYASPKYHTEGKGFLGFSTVTASNPTKNIKVVSEYEIESTYFRVNLKSQTITNTLTPVSAISSSAQTNAVIDNSTIVAYGANGKKRYIPIVTQQTSIDKIKKTKQVTTIDYSSYPTISQTATAGYEENSTIDLTTAVVNTFTGPTGCLIPYLPATVTTTRTQGGLSDTRITSYAYEYYTTNATDPKKYQITKSTETTNSQDATYAVSTEYSNPDTWGHMQTVTVKAKDQNGEDQSRTSSVSYVPEGSSNPSGRFVASKTNNALNEKITFNWDETHGLLNSETTVIGSINGVGGTNRTISYTYNGWGKLVETRFPDGIRKTNVVQWNSDSSAKYYTYSETSGQAPVWVYYNALGREIKRETKGLNGNTIRVFTTYTSDGKVDKVSEPSFKSTFDPATDNHTAYSYDPDYGFVSSVTTPVGTTSTAYEKLKTTVTSPEGTSVTITNAAGQTMTSTVNYKTVTYQYYPNGLTKTSTPQGGQALTMEYNLQGKRTKLIDPDGGTVESKYDGFGELTEEKQIVHANKQQVKTTNHYLTNGLIENIVRENIENFDTQTSTALNSETTSYTYDLNIRSRVNVIELKDKNNNVKNRQTFTYDPTKITDRVMSVKEEIADNSANLRTYISSKEYDALGRIRKEICPSGYYTINSYDSYGNLTEVRDEVGSGRSIWRADTENALGQVTSIYKGAKQTTYTYDPVNHQTTGIQAAGIIDYTYGYYVADGTHHANNLEWRSDNLTTGNRTTQREDFSYDSQNRLTNWDVTRSGQTSYNSMSFDDNGNIISKSDLGAYTLYYGGKNPDGSTTGRPDTDHSAIGPHALSAIERVPASPFPQTDLTVSYTDFNKIATLDEGAKHYDLTYGVDDQRRMSVYKESGVTKLTRYYVGNYEEEILPNGNIRKIHYLSGAVLIQTTGVADSLYYSYCDAQGSLIALVHDGGSVIQRFAYDPWGARRDPNNWNQKDSRISFIINRGYTGHEHLDAFGIINMNGRVYDPATAQFFSPDPYVQAPDDWLNYNRYGYCMGNPLKYSDPTGYITLNDIISGLCFVGGIVLEFIPGGQYIGGCLILAGFAHFAYTINQMQSNNNTMTWDQASNMVGINFSGSVNINGPAANERNYSNGNSSAGSEKPNIEDYPDSRFFQGSDYDANKLLVYLSKDNGVEMSMYKTSQGYYFEDINGYAFGKIGSNSQTKNTYWGSRENGTSIYYMESTIDGTVPFSAKVRNYGYGNFKSQSLEIGLGLGQYYKVMSFYHTHPGNTRLSPGDAFQKIAPCFAIGWDGIPRGPYNYAPDGSVLLDGVVTTPH